MTRYIADTDFNPAIFASASCAFGVFDGLHRGHRFLIDQARKTAGADNRSVVITFDRDPDEVFHPQRLQKLMGNGERLDALEDIGADDLVVLPFTPQLYTLQPQEFLDSLFGLRPPAHLHVGEDFRFGAKAAGTVDDLQRWASDPKWGDGAPKVHSHPLLEVDGAPITATRIRLLLQEGKQAEARRLLGHNL